MEGSFINSLDPPPGPTSSRCRRSAQLAAACDIHEDDPEYRYLGDATGASIVVSIPPLRMSHRQQPVPFTIRAAIDDVASVVDLDWQAAAKSEMPPTEFSLQGLPRGIAKLADFYTDRSLLQAVKERMPFPCDTARARRCDRRFRIRTSS